MRLETTRRGTPCSRRIRATFHLGAGVLYSQVGVLGQYAPIHGLGFETRIYDLTYPMIDLYGNLHLTPGAELFFGQRDVNACVAPQHLRLPISVLVAKAMARIGIIGAGAMGTLFGYHLAADCDVTMLDDNEIRLHARSSARACA